MSAIIYKCNKTVAKEKDICECTTKNVGSFLNS